MFRLIAAILLLASASFAAPPNAIGLPDLAPLVPAPGFVLAGQDSMVLPGARCSTFFDRTGGLKTAIALKK